MRGLILGVAALAALFMAGCAKQDPSVARIEGSEPQRLAFGDPQIVQNAFAEKMKICWFNGSAGPLTGYRYDLTPAILEGLDGPSRLDQITLYSGGKNTPAFVVQFHSFNNNTLIATRNLSLPPPLASQVKRDVETWIFGRADCTPPEGYTPPSVSPEDLKHTSIPPAASSSPPASGYPAARLR